LRDQTQSVRRKAEQRKKKENRVDARNESITTLIPRHATKSPIQTEETVAQSWTAGTLPRPLAESPEQFALCHFFNLFVLVPIHPDGPRKFLACLLPLYTATRHDSLLSAATSAVALAVSAGTPWRRDHFRLAFVAFGKALRKAAAVMQDPLTATEDETLMAVLLLGFYEVSEESSSWIVERDVVD
jgi:hypothetical protein